MRGTGRLGPAAEIGPRHRSSELTRNSTIEGHQPVRVQIDKDVRRTVVHMSQMTPHRDYAISRGHASCRQRKQPSVFESPCRGAGVQ